MSDADRNSGRHDDSDSVIETSSGALRDDDRIESGSRRSGDVWGSQQRNRRGAVVLAALGVGALLGALVLPGVRSILLALSGVGLFGAVLTWYLTSGRFVAAATGESIYSAFAATGEELVAEFDLQDERVYAPVRSGDSEGAPVRLFVPSRSDFVVPDADALAALIVSSDDERESGISVQPTGRRLYSEFRRSFRGRVADRPAPLADQLTNALVHELELVDGAFAKTESGRVTVSVSGCAFDPVDQFDHPVVSFLAVGLVSALDAPVTVDVTDADGSFEYLVTCEWDEQ